MHYQIFQRIPFDFHIINAVTINYIVAVQIYKYSFFMHENLFIIFLLSTNNLYIWKCQKKFFIYREINLCLRRMILKLNGTMAKFLKLDYEFFLYNAITKTLQNYLLLEVLQEITNDMIDCLQKIFLRYFEFQKEWTYFMKVFGKNITLKKLLILFFKDITNMRVKYIENLKMIQMVCELHAIIYIIKFVFIFSRKMQFCLCVSKSFRVITNIELTKISQGFKNVTGFELTVLKSTSEKIVAFFNQKISSEIMVFNKSQKYCCMDKRLICI